jgi:hypothetical protein
MARRASNVCDYVRTQLDTFETRGLCRVDSLALSWLAYLSMPPVAERPLEARSLTVAGLARPEWAQSLCGTTFAPALSWELLQACASSPRFAGVCVSDYVEELDERLGIQFSATTFALPGRQTHYVAFRGTDNTLVGWKEDFNMAYEVEVPSQASAVAYLERIAATRTGDILVGGHSKGGNLATYATTTCGDGCFSRVAGVFSHDGPGLSSTVTSGARWAETRRLVDKTIPRSSVVGLLFENQGVDVTVVESGNVGFFQHDPFSWEVVGCDFVCAGRVDDGSAMLDSSLSAWLAESTPEERARFVDAVFGVVQASGERTFKGIRDNWQVALPRMAAAAHGLDASEREVVTWALRALVRHLIPGRDRLPTFGHMMRDALAGRTARRGTPHIF